jgi:3-hydroxy-9,10-secoandrosta-1,3,5(10)-triene-9,17-dione monooxygenase reductase component
MQNSAKPDNEKRALRGALGRFPTGVAIATAVCASGQPVGMTINSLTSISLAPSLLAWSIDRTSASHEVFTSAKRFAVTVLAETQADLAIRFATRGADKFGGLAIDRSNTPVIPNACAWFKCETCRTIRLGDHTMLVGKITAFDTNPVPPLVFLDGGFGHARQPLDAMTRAAA